MKKLLAIISSLAVCGSATAVSVLSYFPSPLKVGANSPDTSSLVPTVLGSPGSYPVITFDNDYLTNASGDITVHIFFCPTCWRTDASYFVSPSSYGTYSTDNGYMDFYIFWYRSDSHFLLTSYSNFSSGLASKKLFSNLNLSNFNGVGGVPSQSLFFSSFAPSNDEFRVLSRWFLGSPFTPSALPSDVVFSLTGLIGNDYDLWLSSVRYNDGYSEGHSVGNSEGYSNGYGSGYSVGNSEGYSNGYGSGYSVGASDGYQNGFNYVSHQFGMWDLWSNAFGSIGNILSIQLFPGLTVGLLISVPIAFAFILWLIHVLKG